MIRSLVDAGRPEVESSRLRAARETRPDPSVSSESQYMMYWLGRLVSAAPVRFHQMIRDG
jgi:hypothetical protein